MPNLDPGSRRTRNFYFSCPRDDSRSVGRTFLANEQPMTGRTVGGEVSLNFTNWRAPMTDDPMTDDPNKKQNDPTQSGGKSGQQQGQQSRQQQRNTDDSSRKRPLQRGTDAEQDRENRTRVDSVELPKPFMNRDTAPM